MRTQPVLPCLLPSPLRRSSPSRARSPTLQPARRPQHEPDGRGEQPRPLLRKGLQGRTRGAGLAGLRGGGDARSPVLGSRGCPVPKPPAPGPQTSSCERVPRPRGAAPALPATPSLGEVQHLCPAPAGSGLWSRLPAGCWAGMALDAGWPPSLRAGVTPSGCDPGGCAQGAAASQHQVLERSELVHLFGTG